MTKAITIVILALATLAGINAKAQQVSTGSQMYEEQMKRFEGLARTEAKINFFNMIQQQRGGSFFIEDMDLVQDKRNVFDSQDDGTRIWLKLSDQRSCQVIAQDRPVKEDYSRFGFTRTESAYNFQYYAFKFKCEDGRVYTLMKTVEAANLFDHLDPGPNRGPITYQILD